VRAYTVDVVDCVRIRSTAKQRRVAAARRGAGGIAVCVRVDVTVSTVRVTAETLVAVLYTTTPCRVKKVRKGKGAYSSLWIGNPLQSYGASPAIRDHTALPATRDAGECAPP